VKTCMKSETTSSWIDDVLASKIPEPVDGNEAEVPPIDRRDLTGEDGVHETGAVSDEGGEIRISVNL